MSPDNVFVSRMSVLPKQVVRPSHQQVSQQSHQDDDQPSSQNKDTPIESAKLLLSGDGELLEVQGLLRHAAVLGEMLALSIAYLLQQLLGSIVSFHGSPRSRPSTGDRLRASPSSTSSHSPPWTNSGRSARAPAGSRPGAR